ncbi:tRNA modification GTPase TrmE [Legionella birminghamensis]|uniref:tRNA modification GTPase MnmE n=1 Tax=Legionella birminghamensis TaxID=28083 RepID=A0A378IEI7_9GAMM|nr:tRNA uridine-5-carboxymethylaminomethyl(34) synthesis GTPase MnmE [Legionella birminghamensis]KTC68769.1 tRNA modification GTPase TrmE [Legionella birminghamensis]STX33290.1 GTP binding protein in thiophene and furan oxidation (GTPase) [Legionella birminghamensis]
MNSETIVAIATPPGRGGVGIVRVSGSLAYSIGLQLSRQIKLIPRQAIYSNFYNQNQEVIDQGLILYFQNPNSFTGEDVIEFQGHGSPVVLDYLVNECLACGARLARPGEFSERAFLNDKIDLTQAEAIADLIHASSLTAARMAVRSLQGEFSKKIHALNEQIIHLRMYVEAAIDFPEEEVDFLSDGKILGQLQTILAELQAIRANANQGALLREGLSIVIVGKPNAGKSTLINHLAGREVAIVTDIAGTTRDIMREEVLLDDLPVHFIDTAGLRESEDTVEQEGIKRAWQAIKQADCVLMIMDITNNQPECSISNEVKASLPENIPFIKVYNKIDLRPSLSLPDDESIYISAKAGKGIEALKNKIKSIVGYQAAEGQFIARRRHLQALEQAHLFLINGLNQLVELKAGELLAEDLRQAHQQLCEITGEFSSDDLLGKIFSSFCIGK